MMQEERITFEENVIKSIKSIKGEWFEEKSELITAGYIDSYELIKLVNELEKVFDIKIPLERVDTDRFNNVDDICILMKEITTKH
jgi:acyl carrier protein